MKNLFNNKLFCWISWTANFWIGIVAPVVGVGVWFLFFILWLIYAEKDSIPVIA